MNNYKLINNKMILFVVENGLNTSYIDALFVSLYFKPSYIQNMLSENLTDLCALHLQDMIYNYFVYNLRNGYSIDNQMMNEIRNYMIFCGWKKDGDIIGLYEIQDFYSFLMDKFNQEKITFICDRNRIVEENFINLVVNNDSSVKLMLDDYLTKLGNYELKNIPKFVSIFLDRNIFSAKINNSMIGIEEGIKLSNKNSTNNKNIMWKIHSIVCFSRTEKNHYYSIVYNEGLWYMFSSLKLPSLVNINLQDEDLALKIQKECVFISYTLDSQCE
jgi:hypothetical protein